MPSRISSSVVIGRTAEIDRVREAIEAALVRRPTPLLISGEAGVGKTRLVEELAKIAADRGMFVLRGTCENIGDGGLPYGPIVEALRGLVASFDPDVIRGAIGPSATELGMLLPSLGGGAASDGATQRQWLQARIFDALLGLLQRLAATNPVVVVLEDLHWSDQATRDATAFLARALRADQVLLALTFRSDELHRRHPLLPWLAEVERAAAIERIELHRLGESDVRALIMEIAGTGLDEDQVDLIFRRSDGNPFFVEELLAAHGESAGTTRLPSTLRDILLARIAAIPDAAQDLLAVAAIAGQQVDHDLLVTLSGASESDALAAIRAAVASQLLVSITLPDGRDGFAFRHALVLEAVTDDLLPGERRRLHRRSAEVLARRAPGTGAVAAAYWASLAHHWEEAGVEARAFDASYRAALSAEATFAFAAAVQHYERALDLWSMVPEAAAITGMDRIGLLALAAQAARLKGDAHRDTQLRREAIAAIGDSADPARLGILHEQLGRAFWNSGNSGEAIAAYEEAVRLIPESPPTAERAIVLAGLGQMLMLLDRWDDSRAICEEAIRVARQVGARAAEGHALNTLGTDLGARGACADAIAALQAAQGIALEVRQADDIARSFVNLCDVLFVCGDLPRAAEVAEQGVRVADEHGLRSSYGNVLRSSSVYVHYDLGRWDIALQRTAEAFSGGSADASTERDRLTRSASLLVAVGSPDAGARLEALADLLRDGPIESQFHAPLCTARVELAIWEGRPADALLAAERGVATLRDKDMPWHLIRLHRVAARAAADLAEVGRAKREPALAAEAVERLTRLTVQRTRVVDRGAMQHTGRGALAPAAEAATAEAEARRADGIADPGAWQAVVGLWRIASQPYPTAYALWRQAEAELLAGNRAAAVEPLAEAKAIADRLGAKPLAAALASIAGRARLRLDGRPAASEAAGPRDSVSRPADAEDPFGLSNREREVLGLLALGRTNRQIADELFISTNTAGVHVSHILGKLGASGRTEAATIAVRLGLIGPN